MGTFEKSFTREMGKNTGKVLSNLMFGDLHSTPYRRVGSNSTPRTRQYVEPNPPRISKADIRHIELMEQLETENRLKTQMYNEQQEDKKQRLQVEYVNQMQKNIKDALSFSIDIHDDDIQDNLNELVSILETKTWHNKNEFILKSAFDKNKNRLENQLADIYLGKLEECIKGLSISSLPQSQQKLYRKFGFKFSKRRFSILYGPWGLIWLYSSTLIKWILNLAFVSKNKLSEIPIKQIIEQDKTIKPEKQAEEAQQDIIIENAKHSIFIDLNENQRIESSLSSIWSRYEGIISNELLCRKPIFSADAVKDSILFVGVNPSYNILDDELLIQSADGNSLLYGSLYQIPDAPDYFKALEHFSSELEVGYSHLNLLYVRENDRDLLLRCNHNFIREQLELTYDTIIKMKPIAIVFFSDYCKNLIFGEDRWVSPKSESKGHFRLNGTSIPVFFTDDIAVLSDADQSELIGMIQKLI